MSWVAFVIPGRLAEYDLDAFRPANAVVISSHALISDARDAVEAYRARQEREALEAAGQRDLFREGV